MCGEGENACACVCACLLILGTRGIRVCTSIWAAGHLGSGRGKMRSRDGGSPSFLLLYFTFILISFLVLLVYVILVSSIDYLILS